MPVTYQPPGFNDAMYLSPAPFVDISKEYDKMANGEIIGVRYSITLTGTLIADKGSPRHRNASDLFTATNTTGALNHDDNTDITNGRKVDDNVAENVVPSLDTNTGLPGLDFITSSDVAGGVDPDMTEGGYDPANLGMNPEQWYLALQRKQIAIMNLFSKETEGGELVIKAPSAGSAEGWRFYPRIVSVDFPSHDPGQPNIAPYTISLEADYVVGPDGISDLDDFRHNIDNAGRKNRWLVTDASESWEIEESDHFAIRGIGKDNASFSGANARSQITSGTEDLDKDDIGDVIQSFDKVYVLTHTISATGKARFNDGFGRESTGIDNTALNAATRLQDDKFSKQYQTDANGNTIGEAWQQARGFINDKLEYQRARRFTEGDDLTEDSASITFGQKFNDLDFLGMNIPSDNNATPYENYKGFNYTRTQSVDKSGGSFSITETWVLAPEGNKVIQQFSFDVSDSEDGLVEVSVSGSIQGLNDIFASFTAVTDEDSGSFDEDTFRDEFSELSQPSPQMDISDDTTPTDSSDNTSLTNSQYENAELHYNEIHGMIYRIAENYVNRLRRYNHYDKTTQEGTRTNKDGKGYIYGVKLHPKATSSSVAMQPSTGIITYSMSFNNRKMNFIPYVISEDIDVQDTYPGQVFGSTAVIGRAGGPVLQDIGTQTQWERSLSITCQVDVHNYYVVDDYDYGMANITDTSGDIDGIDFDDATDGINKTKTLKNPNRLDDQYRATTQEYDGDTRHEGLVEEQQGDDVVKRTELQVGNFDDTAGATFNNIEQGNTTTNINGYGHPYKDSTGIRSWVSPLAKRPSQNEAQFEAIKEIIDAYRPIKGIEGVLKVFMNAPSESWNPKTGSWSWNVSWVYEVTNDLYGGSYTKHGWDSTNLKQYHNRARYPYPGATFDGAKKRKTKQ